MACTEARLVHMSSLKEPSYSNGRLLLVAAVALSALAVLYREVVVDLVRVWSTDSNYSHGFLIPPIALFLAWERAHHRWSDAHYMVRRMLPMLGGYPPPLARRSGPHGRSALCLLLLDACGNAASRRRMLSSSSEPTSAPK